MLVDNPPGPTSPRLMPFAMDSINLSDFFNFDLAPSSSRSSSGSPSSHDNLPLPLTPPQQHHHEPMAFAQDASDMFNMYLADDYSKLGPAPGPDFELFPMNMGMSAFVQPSSSSSDSSASGSVADSHSPAPVLAIDPQLVDKPTPSTSASVHMDDEDEDDDEEEEPEEPIPPIKVGGKGRGRKGTVASGGVTKRVAERKMSVPKDEDDLDDWRPSPEEYKKLSSKEKRQLRNKISARNFRIRRKEYISTLEGDIAQRDRLIEAIRAELTNTSEENSALRQEIAALKKVLLAGRETPSLPPPTPLTPLSPSSASVTNANSAPARTSSPLVTANTQKDLPSSQSSRPFWGGLSGSGITSVHTTLIPEFPSAAALAGKAVAGVGAPSPHLQENINPALNPTSAALASLLGGGHGGQDAQQQQQQQQPFDVFSEMPTFTFKNLDPYRIRLWGQVGAQNGKPQQPQQQPPISTTALLQLQLQQQLQQRQQQQQQQASSSALANGMQRAWFASPTLSAKNVALSPTLPSRSPLSSLNNASLSSSSSSPHTSAHASLNSTGGAPTAQHAMLAGLASQTLIGRMSSAFWDAFSGGADKNGKKAWDADKVRRVLEGKAELRVVDIEQPEKVLSPKVVAKVTTSSSSSSSGPASLDALEERMSRLALAQGENSLSKKPSTARFNSLSSSAPAGMSMTKREQQQAECSKQMCLATEQCLRDATGLYAAVHKK